MQDKSSGANSPSGEVARRSLDSTATRPNYLNLNASSSLSRLNQSSPSPASRMVSRMTTLHEEKPAVSPVEISLQSPAEEEDQKVHIDFCTYFVQYINYLVRQFIS